MNSTNISLSTYLSNLQLTMIQSLLTPVYIIGIFNNIANILVFSQHSLRSHICSCYFIGSSIGHLLYLNLGCLTRVIWAWSQYDLSLYSLPFCKCRIHFLLDGLLGSRYLFCLISIDRWMTTSKHRAIRQLSSPKTASRLLIGGISLIIIINVLVAVGYVINKIGGCGPSSEPVYSMFYTIFNIILVFAPLSILSIFSLLILFNIRPSTQHDVELITQPTRPTTTHSTRRRFRTKDVQFIKLALVQVAGYILLNILHGYNTIYEQVTQYQVKSANRQAIDTFVYGTGLNLNYTYTAITFYLYTIASITFRKEFMLLYRRCLGFLLRRNLVHPI